MVIAIFFGNISLIIDNRNQNDSTSNQQKIQSPTDTRTIKVNGSGIVNVVPDIASININVFSQKKTASSARESAAQSMQSLMGVFKKFGIEDNDLQTKNYSLYPEYVYEKNEIRRIEAFNVSNNLYIIIRDLDDLGAVLDASIELESDNIRIDNIAFNIDNDKLYKINARKKAIDDALMKAKEIANGINQEIGLPISIIELVDMPYSSPIGISRVMMAEKSSTPTSISPGQIVIEVRVDVTYQLK
ncbi:MAG: hypothetical protein DK305_000030 [Chloroflexi bacterium]|nr:MAG: hypothetical protein DK305_000030 [Chloroflexota bacterium]